MNTRNDRHSVCFSTLNREKKPKTKVVDVHENVQKKLELINLHVSKSITTYKKNETINKKEVIKFVITYNKISTAATGKKEIEHQFTE